MGIASLILGIISLVFAWIPCVGVYALIPAILGLIFGIVGMVKSKKTGEGKGISIAGLVLNILAMTVAILWGLIVVGAAAAA